MAKLRFKRHRFKSEIIRQAVWLYYRFSLSLRDVEEILAAPRSICGETRQPQHRSRESCCAINLCA